MSVKKLKALVSKFNEAEKSDFELFINSPFFNKNKKLSILYQCLYPYLDASNNEKIPLDVITKKCNIRTGTSSLSVHTSKLLHLAEAYLVQLELQKETATYQKLLLQALTDKNNAELHRRYEDAEKRFHPKRKSSTYFLEDYMLKNAYLENLGTTKSLKVFQEFSEETIRSLQVHFFCRMFGHYFSGLSMQNVYNMSFQVDDLDLILKLSRNISVSREPLIKLYYQATLVLKEDKEATFYEFLRLLDQYQDEISSKDLNELYTIAYNFCIRRFNEDNYVNILFDIINKMIEQNALYSGQYMPINRIRNVVVTACILKKFDWAKSFIKTYLTAIRPELRDSVRAFNMSVILFNEQQFEAALVMLNQSEMKSLQYETSRKLLLLKTYYELNEEEALYNLAESFKGFLKKNKAFSTQAKAGMMGFIKILLPLFRTKNGFSRMSPASIKQKIEKQELLSDKQWLLEKLSNLTTR